MKVIQHQTTLANRGKNLTICYGTHNFPTGKILIAMTAEGLCWLGINCTPARLKRDWPKAELIDAPDVTEKTAREVVRLWPKGFENLSVPVVLYGTAFQLRVWKELLKIKPGNTVTYQTVAKKIGKPTASRAVGSAVGKNPVSIVVPCHRVINKDGSIVNYGWGVAQKKALLKGEGVI